MFNLGVLLEDSNPGQGRRWYEKTVINRERDGFSASYPGQSPVSTGRSPGAITKLTLMRLRPRTSTRSGLLIRNLSQGSTPSASVDAHVIEQGCCSGI
jgi:hypothetical protein